MTASKRVHVDLTSSPRAGRSARVVLRRLLDQRCPDVQVGDLELIVSELVVNAVTHGAPPVDMVIVTGTDEIRVEVYDGSPTQPSVPASGHGRSGGGRGLVIVEALSERWGVRARGTGKCVWATYLL